VIFVAGLICKALSLGKCPVLGETLSVSFQDFISINASNLRAFGALHNVRKILLFSFWCGLDPIKLRVDK